MLRSPTRALYLLLALLATAPAGADPAALIPEATAAELPQAALALPAELAATAEIVRGERDGGWEKTLVLRFPTARRSLSTSDGLLEAQAVSNHAAHPRIWSALGSAGQGYSDAMREKTAQRLGLPLPAVAQMSTAADMDKLAIVTRRHGPLIVTVLATAGARSNAQRTGVDSGSHIEGIDDASQGKPAGTINLLALSNIELNDAALARALITVTEGKTAALQDLAVPSSYTPGAQATGTGTDSIIVVSGTAAPRASYTGGHSRIGELLGKAAHAAVIEALGKQNGFYLPGAHTYADPPAMPAKAAGDRRLALLHLNPIPGDIAGNRRRIEAAIREATRHGADWIVTPELAETGYNFVSRIGTHWIAPFPDAWMHRLAAIARDNRLALFIGFAERDRTKDTLHNSVAVIDRDGSILGSYRKQHPVGSAEAWALPGDLGGVFKVDGINVGTLICADAWRPAPAARLAQAGARILISPANWPPAGADGPGEVWEKRSQETRLPLLVANRTGTEPELDFSAGESAVSLNGKRLFSFSAPNGGIFYVDWDGERSFREVRPPTSRKEK
ncbi:adenosylcobinamide amidohydrolase [Azonexus sp.]|uniref:adenosylcobinamide amidohydrolase n=1 Tax=Azonexus sp. TaxID=1872668 RepID=UPI0039E439D3